MAILQDKVAIVTGAGQGIGRGIALALAREGAVVAVAGRTESKLVETANMIEAVGGRALAVRCDVSHAEDITRAVGLTTATFGGIETFSSTTRTTGAGPFALG